MSIIPATRPDIAELKLLVNSAYRGETSKLGWTTEANLLDGIRIDEEILNGYFDDPNVVILKNVDREGQITGCVYLELKTPKLYVGMFSVSPMLQNKGIGRDLLLAAESYAKQLNCRILRMTVISTRYELINWYERRGYNPTGEIQPFHEGARFGKPRQPIELIVMEKNI